MNRREWVSVPPNRDKQLICDLWPECQCRKDCVDDTVTSPVVGLVLAGLMIATALLGLGLLWLGLR